MPRRGLVLTSSLLLLLAGALAGAPAVAQEGGAAPPAVGEKVKLAVALVKGAKLGFEQKVGIEQNMNMGGMEIPTQIELNSTWVDTCEAVDEAGVATVRTKYVRVHGTFTNPMMGEFPFDSDKPSEGGADEGNPMAQVATQITQAFTSMAQVELEMRLGGDGTVVSAKMLGDSNVPGKNAEEMAKQMSGIGAYPKDPIGVGDSWTTESTMTAGMGMKLKTKLKNTVKSIQADTVTLSQEGEISKIPGGGSPPSDDPRQAQMMQMVEKMTIGSTKLTGTMSLSRKDGRLVSGEMDSTVQMSIPESEGGGMSMEQKMRMKISRLDKLPEAAKKEGPKAPDAPAPAPPAGPGK